MEVPTSELVSLERSAAMIQPGQKYPVERVALISICRELLEYRSLLERLGGDLRAVAARARRPAP
jgi:hypothetical protein